MMKKSGIPKSVKKCAGAKQKNGCGGLEYEVFKLWKRNEKRLLISSKDGAFSFANEVPGVFENAKNADGFVEITKLKPSHRTRIEAECCEECRMLVIHY